ncbi:unnamed protein product [Brassicogethes aeneus]|uniref:CLIP domain-containing serine protease n=1 Tax=Brassicogethes aeneus TaxID=1431903 RepID=A0A9P0B891_BRAAE|nr:unnamed protein product [Brassicogethes aeneus]
MCSCYLKIVLALLVLVGYCSCEVSTNNNSNFVDILLNFVEKNVTESFDSENFTLRFELPCDTPNNEVGICVGIKSCKVLMKALYKPNAKKFLIASKCGDPRYDQTNPKVCCGKWGHFVRNPEKMPYMPNGEIPPYNIQHSTLAPADDQIITIDNKFMDNSTTFQEKHTEVHVIDNDINPLPKKCGVQKHIMGGRIFGGEEAELGEFPWMARIIHENDFGYKNFGCAGFLITSRFVMTAAHCLLSDKIAIRGNISSVLLGEHNVKHEIDCTRLNTTCAPPTVEIRVLQQIANPLYEMRSKSHPHDIALLHLAKPITFSEYIQPICLHTKQNYVVYNYYVSGWGKTEAREVSNVKMKLELPRYDHKPCIAKYNQIGLEITDNQICAGGLKGKDSCTGDSGGPLMMSPNGTVWFAAGLVSYGVGCGKEGWPGVYTNIPMYLSWIKSTIREYASVRSDIRIKKL